MYSNIIPVKRRTKWEDQVKKVATVVLTGLAAFVAAGALIYLWLAMTTPSLQEPNRIVSSASAVCSPGYEAKATRCVPKLEKVQPGDHPRRMAQQIIGYADGWRDLCSYEMWDTILFILPAGAYDPRGLHPGDYMGACPRDGDDITYARSVLEQDRLRPSSTDA